MKQNHKKTTYQFGLIAEFAAVIFLTLKGYKILKRRHKTFVGEIDIIAKKKDFLVAVEVKARKHYELIEEVLTEKQKKRIKRAMMVFSTANFFKYKNHNVRFDLIVISPYKLPMHFKGFWE